LSNSLCIYPFAHRYCRLHLRFRSRLMFCDFALALGVVKRRNYKEMYALYVPAKVSMVVSLEPSMKPKIENSSRTKRLLVLICTSYCNSPILCRSAKLQSMEFRTLFFHVPLCITVWCSPGTELKLKRSQVGRVSTFKI
jgi:hypothetical protein